MSDFMRANCPCTPDNPVVAEKMGPLDDWGFFTWTFAILLVIVTLGGMFFPIIFWLILKAMFFNNYRCMTCKKKLPKDSLDTSAIVGQS